MRHSTETHVLDKGTEHIILQRTLENSCQYTKQRGRPVYVVSRPELSRTAQLRTAVVAKTGLLAYKSEQARIFHKAKTHRHV